MSKESKDTIVNIDGPFDPEPTKYHMRVTELEVPMAPQKLATPRASVSAAARRASVARQDTRPSFSEGSENNLTATGKFIYKLLENRLIRYCIYIIPIATLLAIPLIIFATKYRSTKVDGISLLGLFIYIEVVWCSLWIAKLIASSLPYIFQGLCGIISTGVRKYSLLLHAVEIPLSIFFWAIMALLWVPIIYILDQDVYNNRTFVLKKQIIWIETLRKVMKASIGSAALLLGEKILMQLISINYHGKQYRDKIKDIKNTTRAIDVLYAASLRRFYDHHPDFVAEDYDIHDTTNVQKLLRSYSADRAVLRVFGDIHYFGEKLVAAFGRMATDVTGSEVLRPTATHAIVEAALERRVGAEALARRIFKSFVQPGADAVVEGDIVDHLGPGYEEQASFIFAQLDKDGNGDVSLDEMIMLVLSNSRQRKDMWKSANNVKDAIKVLDRVLSFIIFAIVGLIYSAFFSTFVADNYKNMFALLSASAFSFGQTVGEFNAACILVFVKHPFDIGDRINIGDTEYEVVRISLLYSVFRKIDSDTIVQVANNVIGGLWIDNVTRSKAMKERLNFAVNSSTTFSEIEALRAELQAFVSSPENHRDYHDDVEIQLRSIGDLKQLDLRVEIHHKSNWHNEPLRQYRRSKFMCALLSAMHKVGIDGPSGSGASLGSLKNPSYSVAISEATADASKAAAKAEQEEKKHQPDRVLPEVEKTISSGLEILPSLSRGFTMSADGNLVRTAAGIAHGVPQVTRQ